MEWTPLAPELLVSRLQTPAAGCRIVLDTDTYNEIDDPYALLYAMGSPELNLEAVYAAPFYNERSDGPQDGMEKSYAQIREILGLMGSDLPVFRGSSRWMKSEDDAVDSPAARDLIERALASEKPLYVAAIGAPTNVASAILMEPRIREKIVVVWLGGHALHMPKTDEFNMAQDYFASRTLLDSGVPLVQLPCLGVVSHLSVSLPELQYHLADKEKSGAYLLGLTQKEMERCGCLSRVIWDISTIAWLCGVSGMQSGLIPSPVLSPDNTYGSDITRHLIRYVNYIDRDAVFRDLFQKLQ